MRTSKTVDGAKHTYLYASGKLLRETYGNNTLDFFYDANGHPYALSHEIGDAEPVVYYYITNLQGDVMSIVDETGAVKATYEYDPYGNIVTASGTLAEVNPLRYRGYYFDSETGMYYLQSRYYDPEIGRFINADTYISNGQGFVGMNMFAYCLNNPVNGYDPCGTCFHRWDFWNDCEECGGKTLGDKVSNAVTKIKNHHRQIRETEDEITRMQNQLVKDAAEAIADQQIATQQQEFLVQKTQAELISGAIDASCDFIANRFSTYQKAGNTLGLISSGGMFAWEAYKVYQAAVAGTAIGGPLGVALLAGAGFLGAVLNTLAENEVQ